MTQPILYDSGTSPQHTIIWLHGLGADGSDFLPVAQAMQLPIPVRYIFPHAPHRPVTINNGYVMRAWYDIAAGESGIQSNEADIRASQAEIEKLIAQEKQRGIAAKNIFLAGFSQGGVITLHTGLRHSERLGGLIALSTYLPLTDTVADEMTVAARGLPIFMAHGLEDTVIPFASGKRSAEKLAELNCKVEWHEYPMPHSVCGEEVREIQNWLIHHL
jgi:phospholipase/carboxylesterase